MEEKINTYYYVLMCNIDGEDKYFNGFGKCDLWVDNCEFCGFITTILTAARSMKRLIKRNLDKKCKIIKITFLEVV